MTAEQVTARLTSMAQQFAAAAAALPIKQVQYALCAVIAGWLLVIIAQLAAVVISPTSNDSSAVPSTAVTTIAANKGVDIAKLQGLELFGLAGSQPSLATNPTPAEDVAIEAAKTKLNLTLEGIVHTPEASDSVAVIVYQGKQDQYAVGDKLPVGNNVSLAKVMRDHVILDNAGSYESLWLYDDEKSAALATQTMSVQTPSQSGITDNRGDADATDLAQDYRERLYKNPSSLAEVLRISPAQSDGEMVGYRVSPGRDREQFTQLGFQTNDVVTAINGIDLNEPSKALEVYKLMRTAKQATFAVDRNGTSVEVLVSLEE